MRIRVLSLGKVRSSFVQEGEEQYLPRIKKWCRIEVEEIPNERFAALPPEVMRERESEALLTKIKPEETLILLDEQGKQLSSKEFSRFLATRLEESPVVFAIGGFSGWSPEAKRAARYTLSLSPMTFTYQMTRLFLIEQLYRALTIIKGVPYHK